MITPSFLTLRSSRLMGCPTKASGIVAIQGIFERTAIRKLERRKTAAMKPAQRPIATLAARDFKKIWVNWTSENHHQSVISEDIFEKKMNIKNATAKNAQEKNFVVFIRKNRPFLSWPVIIDDGS